MHAILQGFGRRFLRACQGQPPLDRIWIAGVVRAPSSPFRLDPAGFGLDLAGAGMRPAGGSIPNPVLAACLRFLSRRAI